MFGFSDNKFEKKILKKLEAIERYPPDEAMDKLFECVREINRYVKQIDNDTEVNHKLSKWARILRFPLKIVAIKLEAPRYSISVSISGIAVGLTWDTNQDC